MVDMTTSKPCVYADTCTPGTTAEVAALVTVPEIAAPGARAKLMLAVVPGAATETALPFGTHAAVRHVTLL